MTKSYLGNKTKFRGKGIDIRSEGGYVVAPPSERAEGSYDVVVNRKPADIPSSLISWLLEATPPMAGKTSTPGRNREAKNPADDRRVSPSYDFALTPELATEILAELEPKYLTNFSDWFLVTGVLKQHDLHDVWDQWSSKAANYSKAKNEQIWSSSHGILDINYLVWLLRKAGSHASTLLSGGPTSRLRRTLQGSSKLPSTNRT